MTFEIKPALLHKSLDGRGSPFPRTDSSHDFSDRRSERGEAVQHDHADLELGNQTVEVPSSQTLAPQFDKVHPIVGKTIPRIVF